MKQNAHAAHDLKQMQMLPLEAKIAMSKQRIRQWYEHWDGMVYVSVSGKDSNVLKHLVQTTLGVYDVPAVFVDTGLEYPEVRKFNMEQPDVTVIRPKMAFKEVIEKCGYPIATKEQSAFIQECRTTKSERLREIRLNGNKYGRGKISKRWLPLLDAPFKVSDKCCDIMKKNPAKHYEKQTGRKAIIGTMAYESSQRKSNWMMYGCNAFTKKRPTSQPMSFWTEQDVLEYIVRFSVPIPSIYGEVRQDENGKYYTTGADRTGCMFCGFGCHLEKEPNRFQRMKETHPKIYDYCMRPLEEGGLGMREVLNYIGVEVE